ncbi:sulfatase-like hydrolase/transferase [Luteolibacter algae]|uniref:Sulfatase-like hydrolase/transferase n=1 Tax=Luteolibacter algae TaxID=454151 RepID=A0ABW5D9P8_9BACT
MSGKLKLGKVIGFALILAAQNALAATPNIVYILADDMGPGDVSAYNKDGKIPTPNIDRIAAEGMKFMDAHTASAVCSPTRYGIMTGRYSWRTWLKEGVLGPYSPPLIEKERETVATFLKKAGYATAMVGKWHLGMDWKNSAPAKSKRIAAKFVDLTAPIENGPMDRGFDFVLESHPTCMFYIEGRRVEKEVKLLTAADVKERKYVHTKPDWAEDDYVQEEKLTRFASTACEWIRGNAEKPFFLYLPLTSPHNPIVPREGFLGKSGLNDHGDFVMETDWVVGEVLKTLDELKLAENTIVIFTADNGTSPSAGIPEMAKKATRPAGSTVA